MRSSATTVSSRSSFRARRANPLRTVLSARGVMMNVLHASPTERTREIGTSKVIGARRCHILAQFLAEATAVAALGAVFGTALGLIGADGAAALMRTRAEMPIHAGFSAWTMLVALGAPLVVGLACGACPALRAARLSPIDASRPE